MAQEMRTSSLPAPALKSPLQNRGGAPQWNSEGADGRLKASVHFGGWKANSQWPLTEKIEQ